MRRRNHRQNTTQLVAYAGALALCVTGLGYAAYALYGKPVADELGCFEDVRQSHTLVLVDASEPRWNEEQQRGLRRYFEALYDRLGFNEALQIYTSEADQVSDVLTPRFRVCGSAKRASELEAIGASGATSGYLAAQKARLYEEYLAPELRELLSLEPDAARRQRYQSPVLELLQALSRNTEFRAAARLVLVSDLIQNSDTAQFCRTQNDMPAFRTFEQRRVYDRVRPETFDGLTVEVLMLQRPGYGGVNLPHCASEDEIMAFWRDYFTFYGAHSVRFIRMRLGTTG